MSVDSHRTVEAVFKLESPRLIAGLTRLVRDVGLAEELAQDALVAALEQWPKTGVPDSPGAWLMAAAKNRAVNVVRRDQLVARKHEQLEKEQGAHELPDVDESVGDDLLRLIFIACHPVLTVESRVALTLRLLGGLTTDEIARAFLVTEPTVAQRIVRAKKTLSEANVPFELPGRAELAERLSAVLGVIYLVFNEGYSASAGDDVLRPQLCDDALRLGRVLQQLVPGESEVHGLVALMELNASRAAARVGPSGEPVLLLEQNRGLWDVMLVQRGLQSLARAIERGPYVLQAEIAACHARARTAPETDWARIAELYGELDALVPSPVVKLNRAMAVAMAQGPAAGLMLVDAIAEEPALRDYHFLPAARADLLEKLGRKREARAEFERAATLTKNERQRAQLLERAKRSGAP
jgi:RNA polymerase sigma-70 factor (ECF subfamily)